MSTDSQSVETDTPVDLSGGADISQMMIKFDTQDFAHFHVEYREVGDDVLYHFWPPGEEGELVEGFHLCLEEAFFQLLSSGAEVHADHTDLEEARLMLKEGVGLVPQKDFDKEFVVARETYYVQVVDGLKSPMADKFLKGRVFDMIEAEISRSH